MIMRETKEYRQLALASVSNGVIQSIINSVSRYIYSLIFVSLISLSYPLHAAFNTPGQFGVGHDGGASYSVPLVTPPGTAGMAPVLTLGFNSQGGNGIFGLGWSLDGLSQISRCPKTRGDDGVRVGVKYELTDQFCIDGQRMVAINGSYGADGTEYRTKSANFSKIVSYGVAGNGPAYFKVWTKSGQIIEFGNTSDSRIEAQNKSTARIWATNKVLDTKGNYFVVSYIEDSPNGEAYISRIDYTGNQNASPALTPYASVQFVYEDRPDVSGEYVSGSLIMSAHRVKNIKTYLNTTLVKDYRLTYINSGAYIVNDSDIAIGSLMTQIKECDGSTTPICLNPTVFNWVPSVPVTAVFGTPSAAAATNSISIGDTSGDGLGDSLYYSGGAACSTISASGNFNLSKSTGSSYGNGPLVATMYGVGGGRKMTTGGVQCEMLWPKQVLADVNLDGYDDYVANINGYSGGSILVMLSNGNSFGTAQTWGSGYLVDVGDFNGDGKADFLYDSSTPTVAGSLFIGFSSGTSIGSTVSTGLSGGSFICQSPSGSTCGGYTYVSPELATGDFNGDGLADIVFGTTGAMYFSTGSGLAAPTIWTLGHHIVSVGDVNGDGLADILYDTTTPTTFGNLYVAHSTGNEFETKFNTTLAGGGGAAGGGFVCAGYNDPQVSSGCPAQYKNVYKRPYASLSDVNGDGVSDLQYSSGKIHFAKTLAPDLLTGITNGLGEVTTITYQNLSSAGVYTYEIGSTYPIRDLPSATTLKVVSNTTVSDGIGGVVSTDYAYGGGKVDLSGRGSLGFRWVKTSLPDNGLTQTTFYRQDYPYTGLPLQMEKRTTSGVLLAATQNTYASSVYGVGSSQYSFTYLTQALEQNFELNGTLVSSNTSAYEYDAYGNVTKTTVSTSDGFIKTIVNTYLNDTSNWYLGRLLRSEVTSTNP